MHIDSHEALGVLNTLFEILAPSSLRPVDMLLRSMFVTPDTMVSSPCRDGVLDSFVTVWHGGSSAACGPCGAMAGPRICILNRFPDGVDALIWDRTFELMIIY